MFVGQIQAAPYMGKMGISAVRANLPFASMQTTPTQYDRVEIGTHSQADTRSGIYKPSSGQMQAMGSPSYTWAAPDSRLQTELLPPSEQSSYTEEDALLNQYMKQSRIDGYFDGDTFVRTSSEPVKLILKNDISKADLEKFRGELAEKGLEADIDWQGVKEDFVQIGVGFDNIERFEQKADYLASRYAVLKDRTSSGTFLRNLAIEYLHPAPSRSGLIHSRALRFRSQVSRYSGGSLLRPSPLRSLWVRWAKSSCSLIMPPPLFGWNHHRQTFLRKPLPQPTNSRGGNWS